MRAAIEVARLAKTLPERRGSLIHFQVLTLSYSQSKCFVPMSGVRR